MSSPFVLSLVSVIIVSLISLVGMAAVLIAKKKINAVLLYFVSFSAGALFGDAMLHLLPEAAELGFTAAISLFVLLGIVISFIVEKIIHYTHCHLPSSRSHVHSFAYMNLFGDAVHNFIDGLLIAVSYLVSIPVGIATTIAVIFHEIPQEIGDFGVLIHGGFKVRQALFLNFLTALLAVVGAVAAILIAVYIEGIVIPLVAFAAGNFIYIAGADLIPELHKKFTPRSAVLQLAVFLIGIGVMYALLFVEG
ncbi:MAG: ZIP family metal transporter [Candidatus Aenigmarchaeota archaeon]|nr:ZIP family metal transporter [Candidatus Aenigmarchaeota archaeon]